MMHAGERDDASFLGSSASSSSSSGAATPAADPYHLTYWAFVLQGVGMLFPWNVFITAASCKYRLCPHQHQNLHILEVPAHTL